MEQGERFCDSPNDYKLKSPRSDRSLDLSDAIADQTTKSYANSLARIPQSHHYRLLDACEPHRSDGH